jgi:hypothetical protein
MSYSLNAPLFDSLPYQPHSAPSRDAAESMRPTAETGRALVLALLTGKLGGLTDEEIQRMLRMNPSTERPRRCELVAAGKVRDSGRRRATISGRAAVIWEVVR